MKSRQKILSLISGNKDISSFAKDVYRAALRIPSGEVRSYRWVAEAIGRPKAYRAVGSALRRNPYSVIVPCHRIVRSDGSIGEYAIGVKAKRRILASEGVDLKP